MTRLVVFLTLPPATYILLDNPDQLGVYLGTYVAGYAAGKAADIFMKEGDDVSYTTEDILETSSHTTTYGDDMVPRPQNSKSRVRKKRTKGGN